jgi:copper chaperone CopZ
MIIHSLMRPAALAVAVSMSFLAACGTTQTRANAPASVAGVVSADTDAALASASEATLWIEGAGCPKCATNADLELSEVPGVASARTNLALGAVEVRFEDSPKPTSAQLDRAITNAGLRLVRIGAR